jgi:hypothetical protein
MACPQHPRQRRALRGGEPEPDAWDLERRETDDRICDSALLITYNSDVPLGDVSVASIML